MFVCLFVCLLACLFACLLVCVFVCLVVCGCSSRVPSSPVLSPEPNRKPQFLGLPALIRQIPTTPQGLGGNHPKQIYTWGVQANLNKSTGCFFFPPFFSCCCFLFFSFLLSSRIHPQGTLHSILLEAASAAPKRVPKKPTPFRNSQGVLVGTAPFGCVWDPNVTLERDPLGPRIYPTSCVTTIITRVAGCLMRLFRLLKDTTHFCWLPL